METRELIGGSAKFRALLDEVNLVAPVDSTVLIQGETATGKELIARAIHEAGHRRANRFVAMNCAAIPAALLENELFGSERGALTGAVVQTTGRFQAADRGTLFLDEIGELPLDLQPKLLRALQERQFERLGSCRPIQVNVRVIAATNQDLGRLVQEKKFRADLFYRLNVFPITLPPLRERRDDIPLLAEHFVEAFARQQSKIIDSIPEDVIMALQRYDWPGNVRELQNVIERGVVRTTGRVLSRQTTADLADASALQGCGPSVSAPASGHVGIRTLMDAERAHITAVLRETNGRVGGPRGAAAHLGVARTTLIGRMHKLGISKARDRSVTPSQGLGEGSCASLRVIEAAAG